MCTVTNALLAALVVARSAAAQEPALRCRHERCRYLSSDDYNRHLYAVEDTQITITHHIGSLVISCESSSVLESPAMPRAEPELRVTHVELRFCALPATGSLADTFAALNVTLECSEPDMSDTPRGNLTLYSPPPVPPLAAKHFAGLERLVYLDITGDWSTRSSYDRNFLAPLRNLRGLVVENFVLATGDLDAAISLRELELCAVSLEGLPVVTTLESLRVTGWEELQSAPLARCNSLRKLRLMDPAVESLPDGWLANCSRLEELVIEDANHLTALPPKLLLGANGLTHLVLRQGVLETLPVGLLDYSPNLRTFKLEFNRLRMLLSGTFSVARRVRELDLSWNELEGDVMNALAPLEELTELNLEYNQRLGDICGSDGYSTIRQSTKLKHLLLRQTSVSRICRDWQKNMTFLEKLDLGHTNVSELSFEELQFSRAVKAEVVLPAASVTALVMTRGDYNNASRELASGASVLLDTEFKCDCRMYWTWRALNRSLSAFELVCEDGQLLRELTSEDMVCARPEECAVAELPHACTCTVRPDEDPTRDGLLVGVRCEHAALYNMPRPRALNVSTERFYELKLAHNNIAELHADDLQHNIKGLDLRNNFLNGVDKETAKRLGSIDGMLRLAGNPLECSCHAAPLLRALSARNATRTDLSNVTCSDGISLNAAPIFDCSVVVSGASSIAIVFGVLLVIAVTAVACLWSRERRFFALAVLHRWGFVWRAAEPEEDDGRRYDAFVTFSHKDEVKVVELIARLEPPYRLCVHYRDWIPGCYISDQVVESVRESRRTVALVSQHFLASSWARAEFREAHAAAMLDARPRLIVVLLEEPAALEMDEKLRRYVATRTYLRWGEPWFWDKLAVALPRPRAPATGSTPPTTSPALPALVPPAPASDH